MRHKPLALLAASAAAITLMLTGCQTGSTDDPVMAAADAPPARMNAEAVTPARVGQMIPDVAVHNAAGQRVSLRSLAAEKPMVLVFYRGGWCPFCTKHLEALVKVEPELTKMGYQLVAISPDKPANLRKTASDKGIAYTLLSDSSSAAARSFGLAFRVDEATLDKYEHYGIDLVAASGAAHKELPVPAVFVVQRDGTIAFRHYDPNYKSRLSGEAIIDAARSSR